jgi:hypothetical protein
MSIELKKNSIYRDGWGREVWIIGETKNYPQWYWSVQGDWYERDTGKMLGYRRVMVKDERGFLQESGEHYVHADGYSKNLVSYVGEYK